MVCFLLLMNDRDIQKVKIVGILWTMRNVVALLRDIAIIVLVVVLIGAALFLASSVSGAVQSLGNLGELGGLLGMMQTGGGIEGVIGQLQQDINKGDWKSAENKVNQLEFVIKQSGDAQALNDLQQMKQAIVEKNEVKANAILSKAGGSGGSKSVR